MKKDKISFLNYLLVRIDYNDKGGESSPWIVCLTALFVFLTALLFLFSFLFQLLNRFI